LILDIIKHTMERAKQVKIVIIGAGLIGPRHAESVIKCPDALLYAFVDPSPQAEAVAQRFDVPLYRDIDELLLAAGRTSNPDNDNNNHNSNNSFPDAAIVCSPNATHVPLSKRLLAAGIHVLVEKPVAITVSSGLDLLRHAKQHESINGAKALAGHHRRFNPYVVAAHRALFSKTIGRPLAISGLWALRKPASYYQTPTAWRASSQSGGGPVLINLVHEIDILHYLLGPIVRVYAEQTLSTRGHDAEEGAAIVLKFESGVVGTFLLCDSTPSAHSFEAGTGENPIIPRSGRDFYRIFGSEGTLSVGDMKVERYREGDGEGAWSDEVVEEDVRVGEEVPFDEQVGHLVRVVRGLERPRCSIGDGLRAVVVAEAVRKAMRTGVPVNIDEVSKL
jgi:predicted dehydrogenase